MPPKKKGIRDEDEITEEDSMNMSDLLKSVNILRPKKKPAMSEGHTPSTRSRSKSSRQAQNEDTIDELEDGRHTTSSPAARGPVRSSREVKALKMTTNRTKKQSQPVVQRPFTSNQLHNAQSFLHTLSPNFLAKFIKMKFNDNTDDFLKNISTHKDFSKIRKDITNIINTMKRQTVDITSSLKSLHLDNEHYNVGEKRPIFEQFLFDGLKAMYIITVMQQPKKIRRTNTTGMRLLPNVPNETNRKQQARKKGATHRPKSNPL